MIAGEAAAFGGVYVDEYTPFVGHEIDYTCIASDNSHPTAAGYTAITTALAGATVPEPGSLALTLVGAATVGLARRRRKVAG